MGWAWGRGGSWGTREEVQVKVGSFTFLPFFWLCWVFVDASGLSLVVSGSYCLAEM